MNPLPRFQSGFTADDGAIFLGCLSVMFLVFSFACKRSSLTTSVLPLHRCVLGSSESSRLTAKATFPRMFLTRLLSTCLRAPSICLGRAHCFRCRQISATFPQVAKSKCVAVCAWVASGHRNQICGGYRIARCDLPCATSFKHFGYIYFFLFCRPIH